LSELVELTGIEPVTSWMPFSWAPGCAGSIAAPPGHAGRRRPWSVT